MRRFLMNLGHPNAITLWIKASKGAGICIELVAQHHNQVAGRGGLGH